MAVLCGKRRNLRVRNADGVLEFVGETAESRTEDERDARTQGGARKDEGRSLLGAGEVVGGGFG